MRIILDDDNQNYLRWGNLVASWIANLDARPATTQELKKQMADAGVTGTIPGPDRGVSILQYSDLPTDPLTLMIPTSAMHKARMCQITAGPYPRNIMPSFYDIAYGGAKRVNLSQDEANDFATRRVGEYTINECC